MKVIPSTIDREDSIKLTNTYINNWVRKKVVLHQADINLQTSEKDFQEQVQAYLDDLIIYQFEKKLINQNLDTSFTAEEIENYYTENKQMFVLNDYALRVNYIKLEKSSPEISASILWFKNFTPTDSLNLLEYCKTYATSYFFDSSNWVLLNTLLKGVPLEIYNVESFLQNKKYIEFEKDNDLYLLKIIDYKFKNSVSPLNMEMENIKSIIINTRKLELLEKMRNELFDEALNRGEIEISK